MSTIKAVIEKLDGNGWDAAMWALRAVDGHDRELRLYGVWCARRVQHLMTDQRSIDALEVTERYGRGQATDEQLAAARAAAWAADAAGAASRATRAAAWATRAAAWAAGAAAEASRATRASSWAAEAAGAAWAAVWTAEGADAAAWAAGAAENEDQDAELRRVCECIETGIDPYSMEN